jgi:hypothetical protein
LRRRLSSHLCFTGHPNERLKSWILELRSEGIIPTAYVLETSPIEKLSEREECWISFFRPLGLLYNKSNGNGMRGLKGCVSLLNRQITAERNRLGRGKKLSEERKAKLRGRIPKNSMPILCVETGIEFNSLTHAENGLGLGRHSIRDRIISGKKINGQTLIFK